MTKQPFSYSDLVAFLQRQLGVFADLRELPPGSIYRIATHVAGNLAQIAELRYKRR